MLKLRTAEFKPMSAAFVIAAPAQWQKSLKMYYCNFQCYYFRSEMKKNMDYRSKIVNDTKMLLCEKVAENVAIIHLKSH